MAPRLAALKRRLGGIHEDQPPQTPGEPATAYVSRLDRLLEQPTPALAEKPQRRGRAKRGEEPA
jgi:hypothetical protein